MADSKSTRPTGKSKAMKGKGQKLDTGKGEAGLDIGRRSMSESLVSGGNDGLSVQSVQSGNEERLEDNSKRTLKTLWSSESRKPGHEPHWADEAMKACHS